jgi:acetoin utilization protein AcuB
MKLSQVMTRGVVSIAPDRPVHEALEAMERHAIHHLLVVDNGGIVGIMSARDRGDGQLGREVRDVMHRPVYAATPTTTVREAAELLRGRSIGCLPVMDRGELVGIVTISDLLDLIAGWTARRLHDDRT